MRIENLKLKIKRLPLRKSSLFISFFSLLAVVFFVRITAQQAGQGLEISPPSQEVAVDPGETLTLKSIIRNKGTNALPIKVRIEDFTALGEEGQVELTEDSPYSIKNWAIVTPSSFTLAPGQQREVEATINVPEEAAGGRYGSFVFGVAGEEKPGSAALSQEIASLFLLRISGPAEEKLSLLELRAPRFSEFGPIPFEMKVGNSGNVHVKAYGLVNVTNMLGRKVKDVVIYETNVFPGANRVIKAELDNRFMIGRYSATPVIYYGSTKNQSLTSNVVFYVFPVRIAAVLLVVLLILFFGRKRLSKALKALSGK